MSAPLVVNTVDGAVWTRREATRGGESLYALAGCGRCPEQVMATYAELAEHGIAGVADVLSVPVGAERERVRAAYIEALDKAHKTHPCPQLGDQLWSGCVHYDEAGRMVGVGVCHEERRADAVLAVRDVELERLRARVAELEAAQPPGETYPPALPWAALMDHEDLTDFLDELAASAITHASSEVALGEVEATCGRWRLIAEAQHAHNTAPGQLAEWCTGCNTDHDPDECGYRPETDGAR